MQPYKVELGDSAERAIKKLQKSYPNIQKDLEPVFSLLQSDPNRGMLAKGSPSPETPLRKIKTQSTDLRKGKRQGYRILYKVSLVSRTVDILFIFLREEGYPNQKLILEALKELD